MPAIFISYRKEDTQGAAAHLYKNLSEAFGPQAVLMDVTRSQPGRDVRQVIDEHLAVSAVMLVVIGKAWTDSRDDATGQRKLDSTMDLVRLETAAALKLGLPVIPVLVQGATMVQPAELPPDLADLAFRNPVTLQQSHWGSDVETLVTLLQSLVQGQESQVSGSGVSGGPKPDSAAPAVAARARAARPQPGGRLPWLAMGAAVLGVGVLALGVYGFMVSRASVDQAAAPVPVVDVPVAAAKVDAVAGPVSTAGGVGVASTAPDVKPAPPSKAEVSNVLVPKAVEPSGAMPKVDAAKADPPKPAPAVAAPAQPVAVPASAPATTAANAVVAEPPRPTAASLPPLNSKAAKVLTVQRWTLNSRGCGGGPVTVTGVARFSVEKTSDAIIVTEEFRGSGGGYEVVLSGQVEFGSEQPSYEIPTAGVWTGPNSFKTTGIDRVNTSDGVAPSGASVVRFQTLCG